MSLPLPRPRASIPGLLLLGFFTLPTVAQAADLADRLAATGDRIGTGRVIDRDGAWLWTLSVTPDLSAAGITMAGGTIDWAWPEAGVALVRSPDLGFGARVLGVGGVTGAAPGLWPEEGVHALGGLDGGATDAVDPGASLANGPDIYRENGQWALYAVDAVDPLPTDDTVSGWTPGEWKLAYDGSGITVGSADTAGPSFWCDPVDVRVDVTMPLWGVCALFGLEEEDGTCVDATVRYDAGALCEELAFLVGNEARLDSDACALDDQSLADFYTALYGGYDYVNNDELGAFFRPHRLHPFFDWYLRPDEAAADPALGAPGGVVPLFNSLDDYRAWYEDRYLQLRMPVGVAVVNEQLAFAGITVALTSDFAARLELGDIGACTTADPRLPDPDALTWEPYHYRLFDAPFDRDGQYQRGGLNGYDETGELRVILDPTIVPLDAFASPGSQHGTMTSGPIACRYRPDGPDLGALRGISPGVKFILYPDQSDFSWASAWRRAPDDGVLVLNNSWIWGGDFKRRAFGTLADDDYDALFSVAVEQAGAALRSDVLLVISAGNDGVDWDHVRSELDFRADFQELPLAVVVGGTGPRGYDWREDIAAWMPDAPGRPYDADNQERNLDRPMISRFEWEDLAFYAGTGFGSRVDLVAPGGSFYVPEGACGPVDYACVDAAYNDWIFVVDIQDNPNPGYGPVSIATGTSFSAPHVTAVAAVAAEAWVARHGALPSPAQLRAVLRQGAEDRVGPTWDEVVVLDVEASPDTGGFVYATEEARVEKNGPDDWMGAGRVSATGAIAAALQ